MAVAELVVVPGTPEAPGADARGGNSSNGGGDGGVKEVVQVEEMVGERAR